MARATRQSPDLQPSRPPWLPWPVFPFTSRFAVIGGTRIPYVDEALPGHTGQVSKELAR